jgi:hypothetical protein
MITTNIDVGELLWVAAALPGLWYWAGNRLEAGLDLKAAASIVPRNGRYLWARFSVFLTNVFIGVELVFITLGVAAFFRPTPTDGLPLSRLVTVAALIGASLAITMLAYRWRQVNAEIVHAARDKQKPTRELPPETPPDEFDDDDDRCSTGGHRLGDCPRG